jgi:type IV secretory pathway TrbL component
MYKGFRVTGWFFYPLYMMYSKARSKDIFCKLFRRFLEVSLFALVVKWESRAPRYSLQQLFLLQAAGVFATFAISQTKSCT